jgi:predicted lactoylglutathione lyase
MRRGAYDAGPGYFEDPDGHLWEVIWNPELPGDEVT